MRVLVVGGTGFIGGALVSALRGAGIEVDYTTRQTVDLLKPIHILPIFDVVYICAAMTKFIDCEDDSRAYRINVDAPREIAELLSPAKIIYLSSEAVERGIHTAYGMHKALAELNLRTVCEPVIARLSKVTEESLDDCCDFLVGLGVSGEPGRVYRWKATKPIYSEGLISARI